METGNTTLGELIALFYDEYINLYGDPELASVATAASINELLQDEALAKSEPVLEADAA